MLDHTQVPEAAGPQREGVLFGQDYGSPGMPRIGKIPSLMSPEQLQKERAEAERRGALRRAVYDAALAASASALTARSVTDQVIKDAAEAARKAVAGS
jgi:hypothetical protein